MNICFFWDTVSSAFFIHSLTRLYLSLWGLRSKSSIIYITIREYICHMIASIFWASHFNSEVSIDILIIEFSLSAFRSAESLFFAFWFNENFIRKVRKGISNEFFDFSKKKIREYSEFHQNCHRKKTNSKNLIVILDRHRDRKRKNFKLIFFSNFFFFRDVLRLLLFFVYQSFCCFFVLDSKLIDRSNQSFFSKNFFFNLLIFFSLSFYPLSSFLIDQTIFLIYHFKTAQKADFKSKTFKSAFKNLIEIIIKFYFKSIDFASELASSSRKIKNKKKKNQSNRKWRFFFKTVDYQWISNNQISQSAI